MGVDYDRRKDVFEKVQNMTLADVKEFQAKWVKDLPFTFCILGDLEDLDLEGLEQYGPVKRLSQEELFGY